MKFLLLLFFLMVSACGMQGDLYLPDDNSEDSANNSFSKDTIQKT